jgi:SAM-dependent methyltransferase
MDKQDANPGTAGFPRHNTPSRWVVRFAPLVPAGGVVLDLAAGGGRHARYFLERGHPVVALDRDVSRLADLRAVSHAEVIEADLEDGSPWPLADRRFAGIVVTNYLHRPLMQVLMASLAHGGALIYETFARGNERFGKPRNPDHLLRPGELIEAVRGALRIVAFEEGAIEHPRQAVIQRIAAVAARPEETPPLPL